MKRFLSLAGSLVFLFFLVTRADAADLEFGGEAIPLERAEVAEGLDQELLLLSEAKSRVWLTLRRSGRYLPIIDASIKKTGLAADFRYLPMTLTALSTNYQTQSLAGLWRLSAPSAKAMGLNVTPKIDERLDPVAASVAAAGKLKSLQKTYFNSPVLALAAFLDPTALQAALDSAGGETNFFRLYLPEYLEKAVFQVLAGKILFSAPQVYGYNTTRTWPVLSRKRQKITEEQNLQDLATKNKLDLKTFRDMNPHILSDVAPPDAYIYLP
jgi:membrane-bound lytic murein transglycosylase D